VGELRLNSNLALTRLDGLGSVSIRHLELEYLPITSLAGLEQISLQELSLFEDAELSSLSGLPPLSTLQALSITGCEALQQLDALATVTSVGALALLQTSLQNLDGLSNLQQLDALKLENNHILTTGPRLPLLEQAGAIQVTSNPALTDLSGLSALRSVQDLHISNNPKLTRVELPQLASGGKLVIIANASLDPAPFAALRQLPFAEVKIVANALEREQLSPCPWVDDGECDEAYGACASGSDVKDCQPLYPADRY
jgi:hypothetical protein